MDKIIVGIAEGKVAGGGAQLISYALGSCVGICLYDRRVKLAGMAHIILPEKSMAAVKDNAFKFGDEGVKALMTEMLRKGADRRWMSAKIAGGAKMFETRNEWNIGARNVEAVKSALREEGILLAGEDTGSNYGRTIIFSAEDGSLTVSSVRHRTIVL